MTDAASIPFRKMNGLGNDFVVLDARAQPIKLGAAEAQRIGDRSKGVGCDQVIVMEPSQKADVFMRIFNADGSEVSACGNATRCIALIAAAETGRSDVSVETKAGLLTANVDGADRITIDMGRPRFAWDEIPLAEPFDDTTGIELQIGPIDAPILHSPSVVNVGNPHAIFWVNDVQAYDLARFGPLLENHPIFPERANISLAQVTSRGSLAAAHLGAGRRANQGLRHSRLCRRRCCGAQRADRPPGYRGAARRRAFHRLDQG